MEMENILKSISDIVTDIENEKEKAKDAQDRKQVDKALEGIKDLKEIIRYIMYNFFEEKEKILEMSKNSVFNLFYQGEQKFIDIKEQPLGITKCSPLFENEFVHSLYKNGNLKHIPLALGYDKTEQMLIKELDGDLVKDNSRTFSIKVDDCWFKVFIKGGTFNDTIGEIMFSIN